MRSFSPSWRMAVPVAALALISLTGCAPSVEVSAAQDSNNPACAPMMVALPDNLAGAARRTTSSQATAAWGNPSEVVLRCGVTPPGPTTDRCVGVNGVDWVMKQHGDDWTLTTFGRNPAAEIVLNSTQVNSSTVLAQLADSANKLPKVGGCVGLGDTNTETLPAK